MAPSKPPTMPVTFSAIEHMRLFVAIDLDDTACDLVADAIQRLQAAGRDARFAPREKWHVTLAFLGATPPERCDAIRSALREAVRRIPPFEFTLDAVGAFPNRKRPRVVWVGSSRAQPAFAACAQAVRDAVAPLGYEFDGDVVPHVTVCRSKRPTKPLPDVALGRSAAVRVEAVTLYESVLGSGGSRYEVREHCRLGLRPA